MALKGYNMFRVDNKESNEIGGGLLLYIKENLQASYCAELTEHKFAQSLWCSVKTKKGKLLVGLCYRSPSSSIETTITYSSCYVKQSSRKVTATF